MRHYGSTALLLLLLCPALAVSADIQIGEQSAVVFATAEKGQEILGHEDDFVRRMSPFDRAARMKSDHAVSVEAFLEFAAHNVQPWTPEETARVEAAVRAIGPGLTELAAGLPKEVFFVKSTGNEEGGAVYTRGTAVILPRTELLASERQLQRLLAHELFHILSRANPALRDRLYAVIGFQPCNEIELPAQLAPRKITNPDAPRNDHFIRVSLDGTTVPVVPVLFSSTETYDAKAGREFFAYLTFRLLVVEGDLDKKDFEPAYREGKPRLVGVEDVSGFFEQVGRNTSYVIHPEEILADNFALLVLGTRDAPSPEILEKMREVLSEERPSAEPSSSPSPGQESGKEKAA